MSLRRNSNVSRSVRCLFAVICVLVFIAGVLVGQQAKRSKFEKYLGPAPLAELRLSLLEANSEIVRELSSMDQGYQIPSVSYDVASACFVATTIVSPDFMKQPLETVRTKLWILVVQTRVALKSQFPEISDFKEGRADPDFRMRFRQLKGTSYEVLAEYADGKLFFK